MKRSLYEIHRNMHLFTHIFLCCVKTCYEETMAKEKSKKYELFMIKMISHVIQEKRGSDGAYHDDASIEKVGQ